MPKMPGKLWNSSKEIDAESDIADPAISVCELKSSSYLSKVGKKVGVILIFENDLAAYSISFTFSQI